MRERTDARFGGADFSQSPFTLAWEVTRACALSCLHCRAVAQPKADPRELNHEEAIRVIDQIREVGDPILVVTGGDPLMRRDVFDLLSYAVSLGLRTSLTPSATALANAKNLAKVRDTGVLRLAVSLDGPTAESHDAFRGFRGTFDRTMGIMRDAKEVGLALQINTTVSRYNFPVLDQMVDIVANAGAVQWSVFFLVPTGRGKMDDMVTPEQHEQVFNWLYDLSRTAPFDVKSTAAPAYRRVAIQRAQAASEGQDQRPVAGAGFRFADGLNRPAMGVNDGNGFAFISHIGEVCPSGFLPIVAGNVREQSFAEIYRNSPLFKELRDQARLKGKCGVCEFGSVCGGSRARAYAVTGDYMETDPSCAYVPAGVVAA
ncbi:MAG TPA: TIGR04053 family radical SAM/SPASM domain-containing protein [Dehalococcoidia bacterium]|nr:TIGR04053 family radical SAM/SPASM domain-containing protein [Dehalococcoidia bacterium]